MAEIILRVKVDRTELNALDREVKKSRTLKVGADSKGIKETSDDVNKLGENAKKATSEVQSLGDMLAKKIAWYAISQSVVAVVNSFKEALNTIKEVDSQLATIKKVTDFTDEQMKTIKDGAYEVASAYGVAAQAYLDSVGVFAKAGYRDTVEELGELATKTQLVGDVNSSIANQFLLSVDAAWKYKGSVEDLSKVLDEANEVENNYATSIEKIAIGMPNVASIASMVGMSVEETIAALGTITAVTQQTGPKASTALRALILNITGNINEMFEDEAGQLISWTDEELGVMQRFLHKYAQDVMDTAEASGKLVNPIEAIRALGQALEKGEVSARDMYTELSGLGGKLRTNQLVALVENYRMLDEMLERMGSGDTIGSANREIGVMLDTWESKTNILKNTFAEFVEKNLSTEGIKNFIDEVINLVKSLSTLEHPLAVAGAAIAALMAPTIIKSVKQLGEAFVDVGKAMRGIPVENFASSMATALQTIATTAITVGILIYSKYQEHLRDIREAAQAAADESEQKAKEAISDAENIQDLYDAFEAAKQAYNGTEESKQAYIDSAQALKTALGEEAQAIDVTKMSLAELSDAFGEAAGKKLDYAVTAASESATDAQMNVLALADTNKNSKNPILQAGEQHTVAWSPNAQNGMDGWVDVEHSDAERYSKMITEYANQQQKLRDAKKKYQQEQTEENREEVNRIEGYINEVSDVMDQAYDARMALAIAEANLTAFRSGKTRVNAKGEEESFASEEEAIAAAAKEASEKLLNFSTAFDRVTDASNKATAALEAYKKATETEVTDDAQMIAEAYENFYDQWTKGNYGSNFVSGAIDLMLSPDIINKYQGDIKQLADLLGSEFYSQIFIAGKDENGELIFADGEEAAQRFANVFKTQVANGVDEAGNAVLQFKDEVYATLEETETGLVLEIQDIDELSKAMGGIDPSALIALFEAMGIKTGVSLKPTIEEMYELANWADAVHEKANGLKEIDLARIVETAFSQGKTQDEVWALVNALKEANENGDIDLVIDWDEVETADEKTRELINALEKAGIPITTYVDVTNIQEAEAEVNEYKRYLDNIPREIKTRIYAVKDAQVADRLASGTDNARGGATLVNEEGAEIIQEGDTARIAGGGLPTITYIQSGAKVWDAEETRAILGNKDASVLFEGINAFAGGTKVPNSIKGITHNAGRGVKISSTESTKTLEWHKDYVELRKAEYDLAEARGASTDKLIEKERQIQDAIKGQIEYLQSIGGSQTEIDQLATEWYNINLKIEKTLEDEKKAIEEANQALYDQLVKSVEAKIDKLNKKRDEEKEKIQEQIDALKKENDEEQKKLELEEKQLAVQKAEEKLANAKAQRNVRYFNASTGKWEWKANANDVKSAEEGLADAKKALEDYKNQQALDSKIEKLEKKQDKIDEKYDKKIADYQKVIDMFEEPVMSIKQALKNIEKNVTKDQKSTIKDLNKLLKPLGLKIDTKKIYDSGGVLSGMGGIKGTMADEVILPPDITKKMLTPISTATLSSRMEELRYLYGASGGIAGVTNSNSIGTQYNGNQYTFGNITLTEGQARSTTIYDLVQKSRGLRAYNAM